MAHVSASVYTSHVPAIGVAMDLSSSTRETSPNETIQQRASSDVISPNEFHLLKQEKLKS